MIEFYKSAACGPTWVTDAEVVTVLADRLGTTTDDLVRRCESFVDGWVAKSEDELRACAHDADMLVEIDEYLHEHPTRAAHRGSIIYSVAFSFGIETSEALALCVHAGEVTREGER